MPRTLADDLASDVENTFLSHFAAELLFVPKNGRRRTVTAVYETRSGVIKNDSSHQSTQTMLWVMSSKSETSGIPSLSIGDSVQAYGKWWDFHQIVSEDDGAIVAQFQNININQHGKKPSNL